MKNEAHKNNQDDDSCFELAANKRDHYYTRKKVNTLRGRINRYVFE